MKVYWLKAGFFFCLFEGVFWTWTINFYYYLNPTFRMMRKITYTDALYGGLTLPLSAFLFGLFILYAKKEINLFPPKDKFVK